MNGRSLAERLAAMPAAAARRYIDAMSDAEAAGLAHHWQFWARPAQIAPPGNWRIWLIMAGRGFGKTRAGAEWVRAIGEAQPDARIALVAANLAEARSVMVEGQSGLLHIAPDAARPHWEPSLRRLRWPGGAQAMLFSAAEPESLRGPEHSHARRASPEGNRPQRSASHHRRAAERVCRGLGFGPCADLDPAEGRVWIVGPAPIGAFADRAAQIAIFTAGGWRFVSGVNGMRLYDRTAAVVRIHDGDTWTEPPAIAEPSGGAIVDGDARAVLAILLAALRSNDLLDAT